MALKLWAIIVFISGATISVGGIYLLYLSGSPYYIITGIALCLSAVLVWRRDGRGAMLYVVSLIWTLAWTLFEVVGAFNWWALVPRLAGPFALGALFLIPSIQRLLFRKVVLHLRAAAATGAVMAAAVALLIFLSGRSDEDAAVAGGMPSSSTSSLPVASISDGDWPVYGRDSGGTRYSPLADIGPRNVGNLEVAWTFHTGFFDPRATLEVTPLKVGSSLYLCDGGNHVFSLDLETGKQKWKFDPKGDDRHVAVLTCRGVAYYRMPAASTARECNERIYTSTMDAKLWAVDAATGRPCKGFGIGGFVDLRHGLGPFENGFFMSTSAPAVVRGKIVLGGWVADNQHLGEPSGVVRAFDAVSGKFAWAWDIGRPGVTAEPASNEHYTHDTPNVWAPISADEGLGLVYLPTGNGIPDLWGGYRSANVDKYSSSIVAVDAETGLPRWSFQTTHHDLWDYDIPAQPTLVDLPDGKGKIIPALIQPTKRAETFVLDRRTGRPIVPVRERPVPLGASPGDRLSPTQPFSDFPSLKGPALSEAMMWGFSPFDQLWCRIKFKEADYRGPLTPPGLRSTINYPGYAGGSSWGGISVDPKRMLMVMNINRLATYGRLIPREEANRLNQIMSSKASNAHNLGAPMTGTPFAAEFSPFLSPLGVPCQQPPYGMIGAVDLRTFSLKWSRPFGTARDSGPFGLKTYLPLSLGTPNTGGSLITRSGLVFIAATQERRLRAIEIESGRELWSTALPAGGHATPMTYRSARSGRQFIIVASGGSPLMQSGRSDAIMAFTLPKQ